MIFDSDSAVLVIFCRRPALGSGKQRIAATMGRQKALELSRLLLATTLEDAAEWAGPVIISPANQSDRLWAQALLPGATVIPQPEGNLGDRIGHIEKQIRQRGGERIIFIGSDSPALNPAAITEAAERLRTNEFVFIPAKDGGVTLMGSAMPWPPLEHLPWGTASLFAALMECCDDRASRICVLPTGFDIDTEGDLAGTPALLRNDNRPARQQLCRWISSLDLPDRGHEQPRRISVVIPVLNDNAALANLLNRISELDPGVDEVIVVEGSMQEKCRDLAVAHGAAHLTEEANRGAQLIAGARAASGDILWFLHADSIPPVDAVAHIKMHLLAGHCSGYFRFRFDGARSLGKKLLETAINWRTKVGVPYGDQGLFVTREAYAEAGGHRAIPLFEDVSLVKSLRRQFSCQNLDATMSVSSRRWERDGWLTRSLHNRWLAMAYSLGVAPEKLANQYGYAKKK